MSLPAAVADATWQVSIFPAQDRLGLDLIHRLPQTMQEGGAESRSAEPCLGTSYL